MRRACPCQPASNLCDRHTCACGLFGSLPKPDVLLPRETYHDGCCDQTSCREIEGEGLAAKVQDPIEGEGRARLVNWDRIDNLRPGMRIRGLPSAGENASLREELPAARRCPSYIQRGHS